MPRRGKSCLGIFADPDFRLFWTTRFPVSAFRISGSSTISNGLPLNRKAAPDLCLTPKYLIAWDTILKHAHQEKKVSLVVGGLLAFFSLVWMIILDKIVTA